MSDLFTWAAIGFLGGIVLFYKGFVWLGQKRQMENVPTSKVRAIAMGLVEISGKAFSSKIYKSPFSNKSCVYSKYTIEERRGGRNKYWATIRSSVEGDYFYLRDETGQVLINPKGANLQIGLKNEYKSSFGRDPPPNVMKYLKRQKISFEGLFGMNKTMRFREYYIAKGEKLYIMGTATDNPYVEDGTAQHNYEDIMIHKGKNMYYISDKDERTVVGSLRWKVFGGLVGGGFLTVGCLAIMLLMMGLF